MGDDGGVRPRQPSCAWNGVGRGGTGAPSPYASYAIGSVCHAAVGRGEKGCRCGGEERMGQARGGVG